LVRPVAERRSSPLRFGGLIRPGWSGRSLKGEALAPGMSVGLFGGSFDPPHAGHMHVARTALQRLDLDRIWWLVSPQNPLKSRRALKYAERLEKVRKFACDSRMLVSDVEARLNTTRTIDLVTALQTRHPQVRFIWLMGADNLASFHQWARWRDVFEAMPVAVVSRPQDPVRAQLSLAAHQYACSRIREQDARSLALKTPPVWTYLTSPLHSHSSTTLRARYQQSETDQD
jgi:nicotinate-nucleotide adenylyltransferase